jgi:hypothetical protein
MKIMSKKRIVLGALEFFKGDEVCYSVLHYDTVFIAERFVLIQRDGTTVAAVKVDDFVSLVPSNHSLSPREESILQQISSVYE